MADATPREPLAPDLATRVSEFARACKAAARAFSMYPDGHQALRSSVTRLVGSIGEATDHEEITPQAKDLIGRLAGGRAEKRGFKYVCAPDDYGLDPLAMVEEA